VTFKILLCETKNECQFCDPSTSYDCRWDDVCIDSIMNINDYQSIEELAKAVYEEMESSYSCYYGYDEEDP